MVAEHSKSYILEVMNKRRNFLHLALANTYYFVDVPFTGWDLLSLRLSYWLLDVEVVSDECLKMLRRGIYSCRLGNISYLVLSVLKIFQGIYVEKDLTAE